MLTNSQNVEPCAPKSSIDNSTAKDLAVELSMKWPVNDKIPQLNIKPPDVSCGNVGQNQLNKTACLLCACIGKTPSPQQPT